jgi:hypothetical protein
MSFLADLKTGAVRRGAWTNEFLLSVGFVATGGPGRRGPGTGRTYPRCL